MNLSSLLATDAHPATILIRLMVGAVFLSEGIQKFLFPEDLGPARFEKIGFPDPARSRSGALRGPRLRQVRLLEHGARGPHRLVHAPRLSVPTDRRSRILVPGCGVTAQDLSPLRHATAEAVACQCARRAAGVPDPQKKSPASYKCLRGEKTSRDGRI